MTSRFISLGIDRLSPAEKLQLISEICHSLPEQQPPDLTDEQSHELDRRIALIDAYPTALRPWAEVEARVLGRLQGMHQ
jgi:putative addiction module component (TIGR02574 family)